MICRFFEFLVDNDLGLNNPNVVMKSSDCSIQQCCNSDHSKDLDIKLCSSKFGWTIDRWLKFPDNLLDDLTFSNCDVGIRLIHPIHNQVWICRHVSDDTTSYIISTGSSRTECKNMNQVNYELKKLCAYDGRDLIEGDMNYVN